MRPDMGFQTMQEPEPVGRRQRLRSKPLAERHRDQINRLLGQANGVLGLYSVGVLAELIDEIMSELLQRAIGTEAHCRQRLRARAEREGGDGALEVFEPGEGRGAPNHEALLAAIPERSPVLASD